jgi:hypothetical protein
MRHPWTLLSAIASRTARDGRTNKVRPDRRSVGHCIASVCTAAPITSVGTGLARHSPIAPTSIALGATVRDCGAVLEKCVGGRGRSVLAVSSRCRPRNHVEST